MCVHQKVWYYNLVLVQEEDDEDKTNRIEVRYVT